MRIEGNHDDGRPAPPAAAPGRRPTGALPTAGLAGTGSAGPTVPGPYSGDLTGAWWYTWTGFLLCVLVIAGFSAFGPLTLLHGHVEAGRTG